MSLKLHCNDASASARAVLLVAKALKIDLALVEVDAWLEGPLTSGFKQDDSSYTVPTLVDDECVIWECHAIAEFLVDKYRENDSLFPKYYKHRAAINQFLHYNSRVLLSRLSNILYPIIHKGECEISAIKLQGIHEAYLFLERHLKDDYLAGNELTLADLCCVASVSTFTTIVPIASGKYPELFKWYTRLKALPYYKEANGIGLQKLDAILERKLRAV